MRGFLIFLGFLLLLAGGAVAGAQHAPIDLATIKVLDQVPGSREFLLTQNALYAGAGVAGFGLLLIIIAAATRKAKTNRRAVRDPVPVVDIPIPNLVPAKGVAPTQAAASPSSLPPQPVPAPATVAPPPLRQPAQPPITPQPVAATPPQPQPKPAAAPAAAATPAVKPAPAPQPISPPPAASAPQPAAAAKAPPQAMAAAVAPSPAAAPQPASAAQPVPPAPQAATAPAPKPVQAPQPVATTPPPQPAVAAPTPQPAPTPQLAAAPQAASAPAPQPAATPAPEPKAKPQASAQPPAGFAAAAPQPVGAGTPPPDPRMINRKRVQDLVTINDALKAYHKKNGAYPKAEGLAGANERGAAWIPGLAPEFLAEIPRDPLHAAGTQYVYVSDGANYKLLAQGASLVGSGNVEVLGIKIDQTRNPTPQNAAFGFWTPDFAGA